MNRHLEIEQLFEQEKDAIKAYHVKHTRDEISKHFSVSKSTVDKWRVRLNLPRKTFQHRNIDLPISTEQREVIIGSLLGDGSLTLVGRHGRKHSTFTETHSGKQLGLLEWKMKILTPFSQPIATRLVDGRKKENGKIISDPLTKLTSCMMATITHPTFTELERMWYQRNQDGEYVLKNDRRVKIVPTDLVLTPTIVAVWYFDDGSNAPKNKQATFNTHSFSKSTCEILAEKLGKFGVDCNLYKNRGAYVITTRASSYLNLINLVKEHLPSECVSHKVDLSNYKAPDYSTRFQTKTPKSI